MACVKKSEIFNGSEIFREVERYNLFSQGNIYTTKAIHHFYRTETPSYLGNGSTNLLVGTLKPPKILSIMIPNMESNVSSETMKQEGNYIVIRSMQRRKCSRDFPLRAGVQLYITANL